MKRISRTITYLFCIAALFSCAKEIEQEAETPGEEIIPEGYTLQTFTALSEETKTSISGGNTVWNAGDQIRVIFSDGSASDPFTLTGGANTTTGEFQGLVPNDKTASYAVYPATAYASVSGSTVNVAIPASQPGTFAAGNIAVAKVDSDHNMAFKNVNAFLVFQLKSGTDVTRVEVTSVGGGNLAATVPVSCSGDTPTPGNAFSGSTSSTVSMTTSGAGIYYMSVIPGVTHAKGLKMTYYAGDTETGVYYLNKNLPIVANQMYTLGEVETGRNYYVTVSGAGSKNGMNWANAFSAEQMWKKIHLAGTDAATDAAKLAAIDGATFHIAGGTYDFGDTPNISFNETDPVTLTFKGGYNASTGARNLESNATNITGNDSHACLNLSGNMVITLDGIRIVHGLPSGDKQGALHCSGSDLDLTMVDCVVSDNTNAQTASSDAGAGMVVYNVGAFQATRVTFADNTAYHAPALYCYGTSMTLTDCVFSGNYATNWGGCVRIYNGSPECVFNNCVFSENHAANDSGCFVHSAGTTTFNECEFTGNYCGGNGGALSFSSGTGRVNMYGGSFTGNHANNGGAIYNTQRFAQLSDVTFDGNYATSKGGAAYIARTVNFTRCTVTGNHCKYGGAVFVTGSGYILQIQGGEWSNNYAYNGGAILASDGASIAITVSKGNGTVFDGNYATSGQGGAVRNESSGDVSITGARFTGNSVRSTSTGNNFYGGAVATVHSDSDVTLTDCEFIGNYSELYGGAALSYQSGDAGDKTGSLHVTGCTFDGNYNKYTGTDGVDKDDYYGKYCGAVRLGNDTTPAYFTDCVFKNNYTKRSTVHYPGTQGGAVCVYADNKAFFDHCHFEGNSATRGSAISACFSTAAASSVFLNACSFKGNWSSYRWGSTIYVEAIPTFCMNNCSIADDTYAQSATTDFSGCWLDFEPDKCGVISNCSFIGSARSAANTPITSGSQTILALAGLDSGKYRLINDIIVAGNSQYSLKVYDQSARLYGTKIGTNNGTINGTYNNNHVASDFSNLAWSNDDNAWTWTGTVSNGDTRISASDFDTELADACSDFKDWLDDIGATHKDQLDNYRGSSNWWPGAYQDSEESSTLNVITWNIRSSDMGDTGDHAWSARRGGMAAFINDRQPDIVCMQECEEDQRTYLTSNCSGYSAIYDNTSLSWWQQLSGADRSGEVILYNSTKVTVQSSGHFWLVSGAPTTPTKSSDQNSYRSCAWMKCTYQGQKMLVLDVHLSYRTKNNSTPQSNDVIALRQTEMGVIKTWIDGHYNASSDGWLLFMGDMNTSHYEAIFDEWKDGTYGYFSREGFTGGALGRTYNDWDWENGNVSTIDFQFYKGFPSVKSYTIPTATYSSVDYLSDHWPVVVEYRMN